jgi:hypothetical protein
MQARVFNTLDAGQQGTGTCTRHSCICSLLMSAGGDLMMNSREWVAAAHRIPEDTNRDRSTILQMLPGTVTGTREVPTALSCS